MAPGLRGDPQNPVIEACTDELALRLSGIDKRSHLELATRLLLAHPGRPASRSVMRAAFPVLHRALVEEKLPAKQ